MNRGQEALILADGELLGSIEDTIKRGYFDEWQASTDIEAREAIHAKQAALDSVLYEIREKAKGVLNAD